MRTRSERAALFALALLAGACGDSGPATTPLPDAGRDGAAVTPDAAPDALGDTGLADTDRHADAAHDPAPDPSCLRNGCLRAHTHVGDFTRADIEPFLEPGVSIDNGYSVHAIRLFSDGEEILGTVAIPYGVTAPGGGYSVVANNHGTSGLDDPCALAGTLGGVGLAGLFGARGVIGVATEYPGLGTPGIHPYLVSRSEGHAALDTLRAALDLARFLGVPVSGRAAMVGLSQGGHATLAAAMRHRDYAPELDIRAFAAAAPAAVFEEHWHEALTFDGPHLAFHAMLAFAWADHYGWAGASPWALGREAAIDAAMRETCFVSVSGETLGDRLGTARDQIFSPAFLDAYSTGSWAGFADFGTWFDENRIGPYAQTAPLKIYQGDADLVIAEAWTADLVAALQAGGVTVEYEVVPGAGHLDLAFGFVAEAQLRTDESLAWVLARLSE